MLTIRLSRVGKKKQPSYRILVQEKARDPYGTFIENIGTYNPLVNPAKMIIKKERLEYWISKGAKASDSLNNILINEGLIKGKKVRLVKPKKTAVAETAKKPEVKPETPPATTPPATV